MWSAKPSAPRREDLLPIGIYGSEEGCDIVFLVGRDEPWRLPAIKGVLQNATPVFRAMFSEYFFTEQSQSQSGCDEPHTIRVPDVDGRAFDNLLRFIYAEEVIFQSVETALPTLYAAHKYECLGLVKSCIDFLNRNIRETTIIPILNYVSMFCGDVQNLENRRRERQMIEEEDFLSNTLGGNMVAGGEDLGNVSQNFSMIPPISSSQPSSSQNPEFDSIETECAGLLQNCLQFFDEKAATILTSDEIDEMDLETMRLILTRDTVDIPDEIVVFVAILKWADKEVKRQQLQLTPESKRKVLGESIFLPRYLTMACQSFESEAGPAKSGLFTQEELDCFRRLLQKGITQSELPSPNSSPANNPLGIPSSLRPYYRILARRRRPIQNDGLPSPAKKSKKGLAMSFLQRLKNRKYCCRNSRNQRSRSNNSSQLSSPANSNPSSPRRFSTVSRTPQPKKWNVAVERIVIFLACLFE